MTRSWEGVTLIFYGHQDGQESKAANAGWSQTLDPQANAPVCILLEDEIRHRIKLSCHKECDRIVSKRRGAFTLYGFVVGRFLIPTSRRRRAQRPACGRFKAFRQSLRRDIPRQRRATLDAALHQGGAEPGGHRLGGRAARGCALRGGARGGGRAGGGGGGRRGGRGRKKQKGRA